MALRYSLVIKAVSELIMLLAFPVGMDDETEIALGKLAVSIHEEMALIRGDAIPRHWHILEHSLADDRSLGVQC